jgi:cytochrome o ubiquinol oxidase subunit 2
MRAEVAMRAVSTRTFLRRTLPLTALCTMLASCNEGVLAPKGPVGLAEKTILLDATAIMLAVVVPVILLTLYFAWWYRASNTRAQYRPDWRYSGRIEMIVWSIPALIVLFLGGIAWIGSHNLDPGAPWPGGKKPLDIDVVSMDWKWLFIYPEQNVATVNELTVPVGTPVHFHLTSSSVMNSFFIPALGSQIYTMAGMVTQLVLQADERGIYKGLSAQFSGDGFADMQFSVHAVSEQDFKDWAAAASQNGDRLDSNGYRALLEPSHADPPRTFSSVEPGLFEHAVMATMSTDTH